MQWCVRFCLGNRCLPMFAPIQLATSRFSFLSPQSFLGRNSQNYIAKFFMIDMVAYMQGGMMARQYEIHAHDFQRQGPFFGVGGGCQLPFGTFPKIHPIWQRDPSHKGCNNGKKIVTALKGCNNGKIKLLQCLKVVTMAKKIVTTLKGCDNLLLQSLKVVTINCYNAFTL